jgi:hypothetical protein
MKNKKGAGVVLAIAGVLTLVLGGVGMTGRATGGAIGCHIKNGKQEANGVVPVKAFCEWPIPPDKLNRLLAGYDRHDELFTPLAQSKVLAAQGSSATVLQMHRAKGISDREVVVDWTVSERSGSKRYAWARASDQTATSGKNIVVPVHEGYWEVRPGDGGGSELIYRFQYLPGGTVPEFLVPMFQSSGTEGVLREFRAVAERS